MRPLLTVSLALLASIGGVIGAPPESRVIVRDLRSDPFCRPAERLRPEDSNALGVVYGRVVDENGKPLCADVEILYGDTYSRRAVQAPGTGYFAIALTEEGVTTVIFNERGHVGAHVNVRPGEFCVEVVLPERPGNDGGVTWWGPHGRFISDAGLPDPCTGLGGVPFK